MSLKGRKKKKQKNQLKNLRATALGNRKQGGFGGLQFCKISFMELFDF